MNPDRLLTLSWLEKGKELKAGGTLHIPCDNKHRQEALFNSFKQELKILSEINPTAASQLTPQKRLKDSTLWVVIVKSATDPTAGWVKSPEGEITKVILSRNSISERVRQQLKEGDIDGK